MKTIDAPESRGRAVVSPANLGEGLTSIERASRADYAFPVQVMLLSADAVDHPQLEKIFPLRSIADYAMESLRPTDIDTDLFVPAYFRSAITSTRQAIQQLVSTCPSEAKPLGRLARVLDDHDGLSRLAQMYSSALVQG